MKAASAKQKGRRLQQEVVTQLHKYAPELRKGDIRSTSMGAGGVDVLLSPAAREIYNFDIECKNVEKLNIWKAMEQAVNNQDEGLPVVIFSRNKAKTYIALEFEEFLKILRGEANE